MKAITFNNSFKEDTVILQQGIHIDVFHATVSNDRAYKTTVEGDHYIGLGNHDMSTGRLLLSRHNPPEIIQSKVFNISLSEQKGDINAIYVVAEKDPEDNRVIILLKSIENISNYILKNRDDYILSLLPNQEIEFECIYSGELFIIINNRQRKIGPLIIDKEGNTFIIS